MGKAEDLKKEKLMKTWKEVLQLNIRAFFEYVRGISYGYRDAEGKIHHLEVSEDYRKERGNSVYAFSSPEQVVAQNCAWCWDAYLKGTLKQAYDEKKLTVKEFHCRIPEGISDEAYLELLRGSD